MGVLRLKFRVDQSRDRWEYSGSVTFNIQSGSCNMTLVQSVQRFAIFLINLLGALNFINYWWYKEIPWRWSIVGRYWAPNHIKLNTAKYWFCFQFHHPTVLPSYNLILCDSFCSWMVTNLIHNCNFDHDLKHCVLTALHLRSKN